MSVNRNNGTDIFSAFFPRYFESGAIISHNGGDIFSNFSAFLSTTVGPLLPIAGYFTSETILEVSKWNITTFFVQRWKQMKCNLFICRQHSCFPTMGAINSLRNLVSSVSRSWGREYERRWERGCSLRARDQEISCQSWWTLQVTTNVACIDKNTEKRRQNICAIISVHGRDWLVL